MGGICSLTQGQVQGLVGFQALALDQIRVRVFFLAQVSGQVRARHSFLFSTLTVAEDLGLVASTHMALTTMYNSGFRGSDTMSSLWGPHTHVVHRHV